MIIVRYSQDGKTVEVAEDISGKVRNFKFYDSALRFAERLADKTGDTLDDQVLLALEFNATLSPAEKLWRAVTGEDLSR